MALDGAGVQAHRAGVIAGIVAIAACPPAGAIEAHHHGFLVGHPGQTLEQADRTPEAAKQMPRQREIQRKHHGGGNQENALVAGQGGVHEIAVYLCRRQKISQQRHRPDKRQRHRNRQRQPPVMTIGFDHAAIRAALGKGFPIPYAVLADGSAHQGINGFHNRKMRAQPTTIQPPVFPGYPDHQCHRCGKRQKAAQKNIEYRRAHAGFSRQERVQPERPGIAEQDEMAQRQIEAENIQRRCQHEQQEKCRAQE